MLSSIPGRRIEHELSDRFTVVWAQTGVQRYSTRQGKNPRHESRALNGFLDRTSDLDPSTPEDRALIFTDHDRFDYPALPTADQYANVTFPGDLRPPPAEPEPAVLNGGTYMAVEVLVIRTREFDQEALGEQERIVGRQKINGDPTAPQDPVSHVLKTNPGRPEDERRFLRRGLALLRPRDAGLGRGLVFIAFGRTLSTQVEFVRRAWINNRDFPHVGAGQDALLAQFAEPRLICGATTSCRRSHGGPSLGHGWSRRYTTVFVHWAGRISSPANASALIDRPNYYRWWPASRHIRAQRFSSRVRSVYGTPAATRSTSVSLSD